MATQGVPWIMSFYPESGEFVCKYTIESAIDAPTVIYLNTDYWYRYGYTYDLTVDTVGQKELKNVVID